MSEVIRPHSYRHESKRARIIVVCDKGLPTGSYGVEETFINVDGLWYPESSIKAGASGLRLDQLKQVDESRPFTYAQLKAEGERNKGAIDITGGGRSA